MSASPYITLQDYIILPDIAIKVGIYTLIPVIVKHTVYGVS